MGLDWNPLARPKPGAEAEFERLLEELERGGPGKLTKRKREERLARFQEISDPAYTTLGAPRVGYDAVADAWLRERVEKKGKLEDLEALARDMHGFYVLDLLPPCDGFPRYTHANLYEGVDRCSFRGAFLKDTTDIIGEELFERGYGVMSAAELAAYADDLEAVTRPWATRAGVAHMEQATESPDDEGPELQADILFCAIRWCRFWSARGHGLEPYF
jgi:hypothetical protein